MTKRELKEKCEKLEVEVSKYKGLHDKYFNKYCTLEAENNGLRQLVDVYKKLANIDKEQNVEFVKHKGKIYRVLCYETSKEAGYLEELVLRCKEVGLKNE